MNKQQLVHVEDDWAALAEGTEPVGVDVVGVLNVFVCDDSKHTHAGLTKRRHDRDELTPSSVGSY